MSHSFSTPALIFSIKPLGENNSSVCFFTETEGILYATMYGGHKSKLKSLVSPWNSGIAYFSKSTTTQFLKITDFEPKNYHLSFRQNLYKFWSASLAAELVIKTKCAGSSEECFKIVLQKTQRFNLEDEFYSDIFEYDIYLENIRKNIDATIIIVAQRIGTILDADKIVVLDEGKTVGIGRHEDLMESCEQYRQIYFSQMGGEE